MDENEVTSKMQQNIKQIQKNGWYKLKWEKNGAHTHKPRTEWIASLLTRTAINKRANESASIESVKWQPISRQSAKQMLHFRYLPIYSNSYEQYYRTIKKYTKWQPLFLSLCTVAMAACVCVIDLLVSCLAWPFVCQSYVRLSITSVFLAHRI